MGDEKLRSSRSAFPEPARRRFSSLCVALLLIAGLATPTGTRAAAADDDPAAADEAAALAAAAAAGHRVEALNLRTESGQVFANPSGTFTVEQSAGPVRVRRGAGWVPVDTTLVRGADGTVATAATPATLAFSGGGTATPLVRMADQGKELSLGWPGALPAPTLAGDTATYADVLPGVDLRVTAGVDGFSHVLVVKTAEAARNPALTTLRFDTSTSGLRLTSDAEGNLTAAEADGTPVFQAPAPQMWDSSTTAEARPLDVRLADGDVELRPDQELLAGPQTTYPVYVDPAWTGLRQAWTKISKNFPNQSYWNGANDQAGHPEGDVKVGHESQDGTTWRSFFQMDTQGVRGKQVLSATFSIKETWSWSCTRTEVRLYRTTGIGSGTTWSRQPTAAAFQSGQTVAHGRPGCDDFGVDFNAVEGARAAAAANAPSVTFGLYATNESDTNYWKRFDHRTAKLVIEYNSVPNVPTASKTENPSTKCVTQTNVPYTPNPSPTLAANVADPDRGTVKARFEWRHTGSATTLGTGVTSVSSGSNAKLAIPARVFKDGDRISWKVQAEDPLGAKSAWAPWCELIVDTTRPAAPPGVTSTDFPSDLNRFVDGVGRAGTFKFAAGGIADVAGYGYGLTGSSAETNVKATVLGGEATVTLVPTEDGVNTLTVWSLDRAGNRSDPAIHQFKLTRPAGPVGLWRFNEGGGTGTEDLSGKGHPGTFGGGVAWAPDRNAEPNRAVEFDETGQVSTGAPVVDTDKSFTVAAWVELANFSRAHTVVSQEGTRNSGFYLQYLPAPANKFRFAMVNVDADAFRTDAAAAATAPEFLRWVHLAGVYDAVHREVRLYVNGRLAGKAPHEGAWNATGPLHIGMEKTRGVYQNRWPDAIDEVRVYDRIVGDAEMSQLVNRPAEMLGWWGFEERALPADGSPPFTEDSSGHGHFGLLNGGASYEEGRIGESALSLNGAEQWVGTWPSGPSTDHSFAVSAWVRVDRTDRIQTAVSRPGLHASPFYLQFRPDGAGRGRWAFTVSSDDVAAPAMTRLLSPEFAAPGEWTHLAGVYDETAHEIRLYVNGNQVATQGNVRLWGHGFQGGAEIGRAKFAGRPGDYWAGGIDEVRFFTGVPSDSQL